MKYFVISDIHSFYHSLIEALTQAGYDKNNVNHTLIVCGDIFDRGEDAVATYKFIRSIPKKRRILVRGNHERLYIELLNKEAPEIHDFNNCTVDTFCQIANSVLIKSGAPLCTENDFYPLVSRFYDVDRREYNIWQAVKAIVKNHPITKWIESDEWVNYYELDNYVFIHSFIPIRVKEPYKYELFFKPIYAIESYKCEYDPDWRNADDERWDAASWGCPYEQYLDGLFQPETDSGKILVCGHWHTSDFFERLSPTYVPTNTRDIFYNGELIALDGGVTLTSTMEFYHPQNVLIIEDNLLLDKYGNPIKNTRD